MLWSADVQPVPQGTNGPSNYLSAGQYFISLCVYHDLYGLTTPAFASARRFCGPALGLFSHLVTSRNGKISIPFDFDSTWNSIQINHGSKFNASLLTVFFYSPSI